MLRNQIHNKIKSVTKQYQLSITPKITLFNFYSRNPNPYQGNFQRPPRHVMMPQHQQTPERHQNFQQYPNQQSQQSQPQVSQTLPSSAAEQTQKTEEEQNWQQVRLCKCSDFFIIINCNYS